MNNLTVFEIGAEGESRTISSNDLSQTNGGGNLRYLALGFPIIPFVWTSSISLSPYSIVNYNITNQETIRNGNEMVFKEFSGTGGINQVSFSNGVALSKQLLIGIDASFLFGSIIDDMIIRNIQIPVSDTTMRNVQFSTAFYDRTRFNDFKFKAGIAYFLRLNKESMLNFGVTYDLNQDVGVSRLSRIERRNKSDIVEFTDTLLTNVRGNFIIPRNLGVGISFVKGTQLTVGVDAYFANWEEYRNFDGQNENLRNSYRLNVGAEFVPDFFSVRNYYSRIAYRLGLGYENTPFTINDEQIKEFGINFGVSLPVSSVSAVNLAFNYGQRGFAGSNIIKEEYIRISLGASFNDRWFVRRKYD